jgi:hypothetical protein
MANWLDYEEAYKGGGSRVAGTVKVLRDVRSEPLDNVRDILVYLPPSYPTANRTYPTLYMHDGQNLFLNMGPFGSWHADTNANNLIRFGKMRETIIVGVDNSSDRFCEYAPPGCTYSTTTSGTGAGELTCGGSKFTGTVAHPNLGPVGGHGCTSLHFTNGVGVPSTGYVVDDAYGYNDTGTCSVNAAFGTWFLFNVASPITITNSYLDGNWQVYREDGTPSCKGCSPSAAFGNRNITDSRERRRAPEAATPT